MERRDFLKSSLIGGAAAALGMKVETSIVPPFEFEEATIWSLQQAMKSGAETSLSITRKYLERIEAIDRIGPKICAVIEINPDAEAVAENLDKQDRRGPLHGIPVLLKDNIETGDKMATTAGSLALAEHRAQRDAFIAARLREAGAVILGKTNLSEWANFRSTKSTSGWSSRGGQTKNPYALDRNPCGSSSGSGAAASANLAAVTVGTETDGSIICPSTTNGLVGIKPTLGLVSRSGIIPLSHNQDTAGPMCRTVTDAATLLSVLAAADPNDRASRGFKGIDDYRTALVKTSLKGRRIGVARKFFGFNPKVDAIMENALRVFKDLGATIVDPADLPSHGQYDDSEFEVLLYDFKADMNAFLKSRNLPFKSLVDLIKFNEVNKARVMPHFGQEIFEMAQAKGPLTDRAYREALAKNHRLSRKEGIDAVLRQHKLDAILAPAGGPAWTTDLVNGDHFSGGSSSPAAVSGYPAITVPAGTVRGLPVGLTLFRSAWSEPTLIKLAFNFEQATKVRQAPRFLPTANLDS